MTTLLIDADPIVYRCGFAAEKTSYHIVYEKDGLNEVHFSPDDNYTAGDYMKTWKRNNTDVEILSQTREVIPEPESHAIQTTEFQINSIIRACKDRYDDVGRIRLVLTEGKSFRDSIATVRPYKGNIDPTHKPAHYVLIRNFLRDAYGAEMASGIEADDAVSIEARKDDGERHVVATIDKDLDQIPGVHYDYLRKVFYVVTHAAASRFFWTQALAGDATDNIVGCTGFGLVKAERAINLAWERGEHAVWEDIVALYGKSMALEKCEYKSMKPEAVALEMARLVKLQEYTDHLWTPPEV